MRVIEKAICSSLAFLIFTMGGPWQALAQQETATIVGSVVNNQKSPVPGIKILAKDSSGKKILAEAVTDAEGCYDLANLSIGQYQLTLDPLKSPYQGETVVTALGPQGLTVDWTVSESAKAIASAVPRISCGGPVPFGATGRAIIAGVVASGWLGSVIWAATTTNRPSIHSPTN
jgi:hypothetical protein